MCGGHFPCRAPTISRFLATSNGKLIVLAVKPAHRFKAYESAQRYNSYVQYKKKGKEIYDPHGKVAFSSWGNAILKLNSLLELGKRMLPSKKTEAKKSRN